MMSQPASTRPRLGAPEPRRFVVENDSCATVRHGRGGYRDRTATVAETPISGTYFLIAGWRGRQVPGFECSGAGRVRRRRPGWYRGITQYGDGELGGRSAARTRLVDRKAVRRPASSQRPRGFCCRQRETAAR